jgi:hypothetical protein
MLTDGWGAEEDAHVIIYQKVARFDERNTSPQQAALRTMGNEPNILD